jgi:transposase InsO family protein
MPWIVNNVMDQRIEFIALARSGNFKFKHLCQKFGISRTTGYKWFGRVRDMGLPDALKDHSRKPALSPAVTHKDVEDAIINLRKTYPYWGARKLRVLLRERNFSLRTPCERTINRILKRNHLLVENSPQGKEFGRFEYEKPNQMWQMDYKGEFSVPPGVYCYPLTVLDDHSRYNLVLDAHLKISMDNVRFSLTKAFRLNGLPERMLLDHGAVWYGTADLKHHWTRLNVWLMRLGINLIYASYCHPQTLGKDERFHRTLKYDLLKRSHIDSPDKIQGMFDSFRYEYNHIRPHDSLGLKRPADRYSPSTSPFPESLPSIDYPEGALLKKVNYNGEICYRGFEWPVHKALVGEYVRLVEQDNLTDVYYINTQIRVLNLKEYTYE